MDIWEPITASEQHHPHQQQHEDEFLTGLSAETPGTDMNELLGSVFGESSPSSLELLTPTESETPEHALLPTVLHRIDPGLHHQHPHQFGTRIVGDPDAFLAEPAFMGLGGGDDLDPDSNNNNFCDFTSGIVTPLEGMMPPTATSNTGHVPDMDLGSGGYNSGQSSPGGWADHDAGAGPRTDQARRMTIVIDEARPETLTEVMRVLMESRARVEFRSG